MTRTTVDFSDVQEFEAIPKGEYLVVVEKVEYRESQVEDKYDYLNWELKITEPGEYKDRRLWFITSFSPKALWRMKEVFEQLGIYEAEIEIDWDEESTLVTEPALSGLPGLAAVSQRTYEGRQQNQVDALVAADTPAQGQKKGVPAKKAVSSKTAATKTAEKKPAAATGSRKKFQ